MIIRSPVAIASLCLCAMPGTLPAQSPAQPAAAPSQAVLAPPTTVPLSDTKLRDLVARYVAATAADRPAILLQFGDADVVPTAFEERRFTDLVRQELRRKRKLAPAPTDLLANLDEKRRQFNKMLGIATAPVATVETPAGKMRVALLDAAGNKAAVVFLHGGGNVGADHPGRLDNEMAWGWGVKRTGMIPAAPCKILPRCMDDKAVNAWVLESEVRGVDSVLDAVLASYDLDPDSVYLVGQSMGAFGAWDFARISPDRYAAIVSIAGGCCVKKESLENVRNTDFGIFIGAQDTAATRLSGSRQGRDMLAALREKDKEGYRVEYKEYAGAGHSLPDSVYADVSNFLKTARRRSYPRTVVWRPQVSWRTRFYNLRVDAPSAGMTVRAEMGADNRVLVTSSGVPALTVYLNGHLADFARPVTVTWNGQAAFSGRLVPRYSVILETLAERADAGMFYTARIRLGDKPKGN